MSYILDALKKSEAERSSTDHAEFAHRVPFESVPRKQREIWPYLLVLALLANVLVIGYVVWPESGAVQRQQPVERETANTAPERPVQEEAEATEASGASGAPERSEASAPVIPEERSSATAGGASQTEAPDVPVPETPVQEEKVAAPDPPAEATTTEVAEEVPDINAMPRSVQRRVPEMTFNAHLYSSNPSSRQVMINNRMLREGDRVGDLLIEEITAAGVVFRLNGHVFQIGIVRDWQGAH